METMNDEAILPAVSTVLGNEREKRLLKDLDALKQLVVDGKGDEVTGRLNPSLGQASDSRSTDQATDTDTGTDTFTDTLVPVAPYQMGDHVFKWCSFALVPSVFQHHGIVMDVYWKHKEYSDAAVDGDHHRNQGGWMMTIADFSNADITESAGDVVGVSKEEAYSKNAIRNGSRGLRQVSHHSSSLGSYGSSGCFRTYEVSCDNGDKWFHVEYQAGWWKRHWQRTGTCTAVASDSPGLVRARVQFLIENGAELLPKYDALSANCECVAVWCKTGTWATLQAIHFLAMTAAGQAKSAVTVASVAAATQVTVPSAGLWGWLGYTTQASLLSTQPLLLPAIAAYGVVTVGAPALWLLHSKHKAKRLTTQLNSAFWEHAIRHPHDFADDITLWSSLYEPSIEDTIVLTPSMDVRDEPITEQPRVEPTGASSNLDEERCEPLLTRNGSPFPIKN